MLVGVTPELVDRDTAKLHPLFREAVQALLEWCKSEKLPFALFEGFRSPARQAWLHAQGRTRPGAVVTNARAWESFHQYGLAADIVLKTDAGWSWAASGAAADSWKRMRAQAQALGLEVLSWEMPHVQWKDSMAELKAGSYPPQGDASWAVNLTWHIQQWTGSPPAPVPPATDQDRPPLANAADLLEVEEGLTCGKADCHSMFGGRSWRYDVNGVYLCADGSPAEPLRTPGRLVTIPAIMALYGEYILEASKKYQICPQLILMTIATESAAARNQGFTGPTTFRWEPHVEVSIGGQIDTGDYSAGPMQTLASTARWVITAMKLPYDAHAIAPHIQEQPATAPQALPLYDPRVNIDIGTAEIKIRWDKTGSDPILVAAAYNAGGLYESDKNPWRLRSSGDHLDRAAKWFGDACHFLNNWP
ncbi:putative peptidoglycan-binding domain 1 protein [Megalodesulfovibrio gigas DSM 1382 = ATCC 19364]|uniref:Putative peptidoglycan-binding domain 1 protein n=1 Tax=Megalodesulfovibrio gigas (strain ATCC 19364 / DSM 1382 / NCIMB 9332 / VKM B-1759) TaxID=1121448 RepID=T2G9Q3_MEGG1|nr:putative peptidoglycan-binding domain 1 protein [Megalodesulfovibrio gigas DSM 1382 = ATCC 19364]